MVLLEEIYLEIQDNSQGKRMAITSIAAAVCQQSLQDILKCKTSYIILKMESSR
jgi:hypothetical protein